MASTITRQQRQATPARWHKAVERAIGEDVQVRQLAGCGAWIATSGSDASAAYELEVTGAVAHGCNCLAGINGDPVCKHRAAFYLAIGVLDPEPDPPAPALAFDPGPHRGSDRGEGGRGACSSDTGAAWRSHALVARPGNVDDVSRVIVTPRSFSGETASAHGCGTKPAFEPC